MVCNGYVLGHGSGPKSAEREGSRSSRFVCARVRRISFVLILALILFFPYRSACQDPYDSPLKHASAESAPIFTDVTIWTAQSVGSTNVMSTYPGQEMFATGVGLRRHIYGFRHMEMRWNFEIVPFCMPSFTSADGRTYHYGGGGSLGASLEPRKRWKIQPYFDASVGLLGFTNATPAGTRRKNYSMQFGPGLTIPVRGRSSLKTGIWFFHFSNMRTEPTNPGFDAVVIYMGYTFSFERRSSGPN